MICRMSRQDDGTWRCWCGWVGTDPQEHLGFRAGVYVEDAGGVHVYPEDQW